MEDRGGRNCPGLSPLGGASSRRRRRTDRRTDVILLPVAAYQAVLNPSKVTGNAVDHHGGHTGQRVEESELPSKS